MAVRLFGGSLKATARPRGNPRGGDRSGTAQGHIVPAPAPAFQDAARLLQLYRLASLEMMADDEAKRIGRAHLDATGRHKARKRRDRAAAVARKTPLGRAAIARETEILASAGQAVAMLARAHADVRPVLAHAVDGYVSDVHEFGFTSVVACRWSLQSALFAALAQYLLADSVESGSRIMGAQRSTSEGDVSASVHVAGFKDLVTLAAACSAKAQLATEMAWRAEDRARHEAHAMRSRVALAERHAQAITTLSKASEPESLIVNSESVLPERQETEPLRPEPAPANASPAMVQPPPLPCRPVLTPREAFAWCPLRLAHVPTSIAGSPLRSASVVPRHVVEKLRAADPAWEPPTNWTIEAEPEGEPQS
jgi:hypothetical protein